MSFLKANASVAAAYLRKDFGFDIPFIWTTLKVRFSPTALTFWTTHGQILIETFDSTSWFFGDEDYFGVGFDSTPHWYGGWAGAQTPPDPLTDVWQTIEFGYHASTSEEIYIDGTLLSSTPVTTTADETRSVVIGLYNASFDPDNIADFDDVKFGTTRGADDLGADNFEGGDLSFWTEVVGDVSIIVPVEEPYLSLNPSSTHFYGKYDPNFRGLVEARWVGSQRRKYEGSFATERWTTTVLKRDLFTL